jgi:hypothetical protein
MPKHHHHHHCKSKCKHDGHKKHKCEHDDHKMHKCEHDDHKMQKCEHDGSQKKDKCGHDGKSGGPSQLFENTISIGTAVVVFLVGGNTITGIFRGIVKGSILVGDAYINPKDITAFELD